MRYINEINIFTKFPTTINVNATYNRSAIVLEPNDQLLLIDNYRKKYTYSAKDITYKADLVDNVKYDFNELLKSIGVTYTKIYIINSIISYLALTRQQQKITASNYRLLVFILRNINNKIKPTIYTPGVPIGGTNRVMSLLLRFIQNRTID